MEWSSPPAAPCLQSIDDDESINIPSSSTAQGYLGSTTVTNLSVFLSKSFCYGKTSLWSELIRQHGEEDRIWKNASEVNVSPCSGNASSEAGTVISGSSERFLRSPLLVLGILLVFLKVLPFGVPPNGPKSDDQSAVTFASKHGESLFLPRIISEYPVYAELVDGDIPSFRIRSEYSIDPEGVFFVDGDTPSDPVRAGVCFQPTEPADTQIRSEAHFIADFPADTQIRSEAHFIADFPKSEFAAVSNSACTNIVCIRKTTGAPLEAFKAMVGYSCLIWSILKPPYSLIWQAMILWSIDDDIGWTYCFRCCEHVACSIQEAPFGSNPYYERFGYQFFHRPRMRRSDDVGVLIRCPIITFGDNDFMANINSNPPHAKELHKRHTMLPLHRVHEAIAAKLIMTFDFIPGDKNPSDVLSVTWDYSKVRQTLKPILFWEGERCYGFSRRMLKSLKTLDPVLTDGES
jgi:hypothetical protein